MSDIVERLKHQAMSRMFRSEELSDGTMVWHPMMLEAADEIEKLRAALRPFADLLATAEKIRPSHDRHLLWVETIDLRAAAAALNDKKNDNK